MLDAMKFRRAIIALTAMLALGGPLAVFAQATGTEVAPVDVAPQKTVPQVSPDDLLLTAQNAAMAARDAQLTDREKVLLGALALSLIVMVIALMALSRTRRTFKKHLNEHRDELRRAFADAYVGMKEGATDAKRVRDAEQAIERIISDLEHYLD